jgi:fumarate hydratase class II
MGEMEVPATRTTGASTQRAVINFPISGLPPAPAILEDARVDQGRPRPR